MASNKLFTSVALLGLAVAACGGSDKKNNPDGGGSGSGTDGSSLTCSTHVAFDNSALNLDVANADDTQAVWIGPSTTVLDDGGEADVSVEFYQFGDTPVDLTQPIDLSSGDFTNYSSCAACILVYSSNTTGDDGTTYFQDGGMLHLSMDPIGTQHLIGTATGVSLVEVTIDPDTFASTLVAGGKCVLIGDMTFDRGKAPSDWTCDEAKFNDGTNCDCMCGDHDPDCDLDAPPLMGCTTGQICGANDTCESTCSVFAPQTACTTPQVCAIDSATQDLCLAANDPFIDPAAIGTACATTDLDNGAGALCGVVGGYTTGFCDFFSTDDHKCDKACNKAADCNGGQICQAVTGTKGVCASKPANDTCGTAIGLTLGTAVNGTTAGATSDYNTGLEVCTGFSQKGGDVAYKIDLTAAQAVKIELSNVSSDYDPSVSIVGPGAAGTVCGATTACPAGQGADDGGTGEGETVMFTAATAGTYYVLVDSNSANFSGTFTVKVSAQ